MPELPEVETVKTQLEKKVRPFPFRVSILKKGSGHLSLRLKKT